MSAASRPEGASGLTKTMQARQTAWRSRIVFAAIYGLALSPMAGWIASLAWFSIFVAVQALEAWLYRRGRQVSPDARTALALLFASSVAYGGLSIATALFGGYVGVTCGALFLAGAVLNAVVTNQRSQAAYTAAMTPYIGYFLALCYLAAKLTGAGPKAIALAAVSGLLVFSSSALWRSGAAAFEAQRRARMEADRRRLQAESAVGAKSAFIAMVSHELRTPISAILAGAESIQNAPHAPLDLRANAALIAESGRMMRALLGDLLDLSKIEAGRMSVEIIEMDPAALVSDTVAFWAAQARNKGLTLTVEGLESLPARVAADPTRLRQVLNNLLSNAIKFTDRGGVALAVDAAANADGWKLVFAVADTGVGMTREQFARLFIPFDQTLASTARTHGGTGLGLTISRELARLMGGDLTAASQPGKGATFTLQIQAGPAGSAASTPPEPVAPVTNVRVLGVDDHEVNRRAMALMLEPLGVDLTLAASGEQALALASVAAFDVILMDLYMPEMDGRETTMRLRATPGPNQATPVIACTASTAERDWQACRQAGMTSSVPKPFDAALLHGAIARALDERAAADAVEAAAKASAA
ncbi:MAG: ATP-binding protein [Phenylobacterium sp.]|uniref:ATP-binding protein n=1 Tax=Phenylobacterium sp. TaxID=1871053 RepID=UPI003918A304